MKKIICGFAGIGKSALAKSGLAVDLESTPFKKNWDLYSDVAIHMANSGYTVMLSCHKELRDILLEKGADFEVVIPDRNDKSIYIHRYCRRGNDETFMKLFNDKWYDFIDEILSDGDKLNIHVLNNGEFLKDYYYDESFN